MAKKISPASVEVGDRLQLIYVKVSDLSKWERNPKKHDLPSIKKSFKQHGFKDPPKWEDVLGGLVEGNGRFEALQEMEVTGDDLPRGILKEKGSGNWCAPVLIGVEAKSEKAAEAYAIDHNNLVMVGSGFTDLEIAGLWEPENYVELLRDVVESGESFASITDEGLKALEELIGVEEEQLDDSGAQIDKAEELREKWGVESGQLWHLGEHRVICGDCTDEAVVEKLMGEERADMVFTDPPYNINYDYGEYNDNMPESEYLEFVNSFVAVLTKFASLNCPFYVMSANNRQDDFKRIFIDNCLRFHQWLYWIKPYPGYLGRSDYIQNYETINYGYMGKHKFYGKMQLAAEVIDRDMGFDKVAHPAQRPIVLLEKVLNNSSLKNTIVIDIFLGSGTTLIACERLSRKCRGIEIEPKYVAVTLERWHKMTGKTPVLLNG